VNDLLETILRDSFEKRAGQLDPDVRRRLMAVDYRPRTRWFLLLPALGAAGLAAAAVGLVLLFTLGSNPSPASAFAGWSPTPTPTRPGQTAAAIAKCRLGRPVLVDTRGPFTAAVYANPKPLLVPGLPRVKSSPPEPPFKPAIGSCFVGPHVSGSSTTGAGLPRVGSGQIQLTEQTESGGAQDATVLDGRSGAGVTRLRFDLSNGRRVTATVAHGWYLVWWPGSPHATATEITTPEGTHTYELPPTAEVGAGSCGSCASAGPVITVGR
jgi:hypothetical protein